ncbi:hypothetical protein [Diaphorobacter caeni]|uniref:hypothetical protein n=1 Tax=Diaphorobacter caeni TaxID=2784387 RepID=UPI001890ABB4|nr:hypothetical protein [Diaphorobacter caeni]MBF5004697.1 hypothetical protein [Diaphorobacter caeni]
MDTASPTSTFVLKRGQPPQMLCVSDVQSLRCTHGALQLEWEQSGVLFQHVLYGGGMQWEPHGVPAGTWVRLAVIGRADATLVQESLISYSGRGEILSLLIRVLAALLHVPVLLAAKLSGRLG